MEHASEKYFSVKEEARPFTENEKGHEVRKIGRKGNSLEQVSWKIRVIMSELSQNQKSLSNAIISF